MIARCLGLLVLGALLAAIGCGAVNDPSSRVTTLRVLVVQTDQQGDAIGGDYAHPGELVKVTTLWVDPDADARAKGTMPPVTWQWIGCVNPASSTVVGCLFEFAQELQKAGGDYSKIIASAPGTGTDTFSFVVPRDTIASLPPGAESSAVVGLVALTCPGAIDIALDVNPLHGDLPIRCGVGVDPITKLPIAKKVSDGGSALTLDQWSVGIKRVFIRNKDRNASPIITGILFDGKPWDFEGEGKPPAHSVTTCDSTTNRYADCASSETHDLTVQLDPSSFEKGTDEYGQAFKEDVVVQFYATEGLFEHDIKIGAVPDSNYVVRSAAKTINGGTVRLWFVVRDSRGGVTWVQRQLAAK